MMFLFSIPTWGKLKNKSDKCHANKAAGKIPIRYEELFQVQCVQLIAFTNCWINITPTKLLVFSFSSQSHSTLVLM